MSNGTIVRPLRFTKEEAYAAGDEWGLNCGPSAIAAVCNLTLSDLRPHLGDFERKHYTNPSLMLSILRSLGVPFDLTHKPPVRGDWPRYGLARIQWEGPWTRPGVPIAARYRHTHWVGVMLKERTYYIFDINAMEVGGWITLGVWASQLLPWLLEHCEPKADGRWHITHAIEVRERKA